MPNQHPIASFRTTITDAISDTATTIPIDKVIDDDGVSMDGLILTFIIDKGTSVEEYVTGTVDAANSQLVTVTRGVSTRDGASSVAALKHPHRKKMPIEITDHPYLAQAMRQLDGTDNLGGIPKNPTSRTINNSRHLADKEYVDLVAGAAGGISAFLVSDAGGINVDVGAGILVTSEGVVEYAGASGQALTNNATNYIELDHNGVLRINTTSWTRGYVPLAKVTTLSNDITVLTDSRGWLTNPESDRSITDDAIYGATIAVGDAVYLDTTDGKWKLADASAASTSLAAFGIALDAGDDTDTGKRVQVGGIVTGLTGLTVGYVYVSDTAGDLSATPGTFKKVIGYAFTTTSLLLLPALDVAAIAGTNADVTTDNINEAATFFANTNMTAAEAETLTDGSDASALHSHNPGFPSFSETITDRLATLTDTGRANFAMDPSGTYGYFSFARGASGNENIDVYRFVVDPATKLFLYDGVFAQLADSTYSFNGVTSHAIVATENFVYAIGRGASTTVIIRMLPDLTSPTLFTISGATYSASHLVSACGNDTDIYIAANTNTLLLHYTLSGTTATRAADITLTSGVVGVVGFDGTHIYQYDPATGNIRKYTTAGGSPVSTTRRQFAFDTNAFVAGNISNNHALGLMPTDEFLIGVGMALVDGSVKDATHLRFYKISKP